jgi:predicted enzyme related to lactoylglutathione lyase
VPELIRHFAINADDVDRAAAFYTAVLGWTFTPWGPPGFLKVDGAGEVVGALQQRRDLDGRRATGFECTVPVPDLDAVAAAVVAHGGRIVMEPSTIAGVGRLLFFADPEGNVAGAMQYDRPAGRRADWAP